MRPSLRKLHRKLADTLGISRREAAALSLLFGIGVGGHVVRAVTRVAAPPSIAASILDPAGDGNPLAHLDSIQHLAKELGAHERIDIDHAGLADLERLPGVGPALAKRIVADRQTNGEFASLDDLRRVRGLSGKLIAQLAPHLSFGAIPAEAQGTGLPDAIDLNLATVEDLDGLPGIGKKRARAIVAFRDSAGPFRQLEDLKRVPGVTAALLRRLSGRLIVP